jgi:hypothetical protein
MFHPPGLVSQQAYDRPAWRNRAVRRYEEEVTFLKKSNQKTFAPGAPGLRAD